MRAVGILGGMGPEATILLMQKVLAAVPARDDADHVPLIVHQNPAVPSRIARLVEGRGADPGPVLETMARDLATAGAAALAMPCNTAHAWAKRIAAATPLPFLDMRHAAIARLPPDARRIGLLASPAVVRAGVFDASFAKAGLAAIHPVDADAALALIRRIKAGDTGPAAAAEFRRQAEALAASSDHLLVACTEFSLLTPALDGLPWTDALDALVAEIVAFARS